MATIPCFHVDAFTDRAFRGNPAAVCLLAAPRPAAWLQAVAAEMNLSETAFVQPVAGGFRLRWFTPQVEVDLCGHATLAAAHVLWSEGLAPRAQELVFRTRSGVPRCRWREPHVELDFPARSPVVCRAPAQLVRALGVRPNWVGRNQDDFVVEVASAAVVRGLQPDLGLLREVPARGVAVTAKGRGGVDFVSRFFAPAVGVPEDPVTGSAHCALGPYWAARLGRQHLVGEQLSARGGRVVVELAGDRVLLRGGAVTVVRGELVA